MIPGTNEFEGVVVRTAGDSIAYVAVELLGKTISFLAADVKDYCGESFEMLQIVQGAKVSFTWHHDGTASNVVVEKDTEGNRAWGAIGSILFPKQQKPETDPEQAVLHRDDATNAASVKITSLHAKVRNFGKFLDVTNLQPGDLMLARSHGPIPKLISSTQIKGGYHDRDAQWTHAAMYLGDGANFIEANFDFGNYACVRLAPIRQYCDGQYDLRFRRLKAGVDSLEQKLSLCVQAMKHLGTKYPVGRLAEIWFDVNISKTSNFYDSDLKDPLERAVVCSTLYQDAVRCATKYQLGEDNGACVPAWLSASDKFENIRASWKRIS